MVPRAVRSGLVRFGRRSTIREGFHWADRDTAVVGVGADRVRLRWRASTALIVALNSRVVRRV